MLMKERFITLLTDFGTKDPYTASLKGAILTINPKVDIIDITHDIPPQDIFEAAFILKCTYKFFPRDTIHIAVVDPGVGGSRRPILVKTRDYMFVGPDNGIFSFILEEEEEKYIYHLNNRKYHLPVISDTFHGRDIFAPVAAHLSLGVNPEKVGELIETAFVLDIPKPEIKKGKICGTIIHVDRFGNLITNISSHLFNNFVGNNPFEIELAQRTIKKINRAYSESNPGELLAIFGSAGFLEISINLGNCSRELSLGKGDRISVRVHRLVG